VPMRLQSVFVELDARRCSLVWLGRIRVDGLKRAALTAVVAPAAAIDDRWAGKRAPTPPPAEQRIDDLQTIERPPKRLSTVMIRQVDTGDVSAAAEKAVESSALPRSFKAAPRTAAEQPRVPATPFDGYATSPSRVEASPVAPVVGARMATPPASLLTETLEDLWSGNPGAALPFRTAPPGAPRHPTPGAMIKATPFDGASTVHSSSTPPREPHPIHPTPPPAPIVPTEIARSVPAAYVDVAPPARLASLIEHEDEDAEDDDDAQTRTDAIDPSLVTLDQPPPKKAGLTDTQDEVDEPARQDVLPFRGGVPSRASVDLTALPHATPFDGVATSQQPVGTLGAFFLRAIGIPVAS
jgi:hypothetical protein